MPKWARFDASGTLHNIIVRGMERRRIVDDLIDRDNFVCLAWDRLPLRIEQLSKVGH